jgi:hypothetical protein
VSIQVLSDAFWIRMFLLSDMGFAEAYMVGDIRVDRLDALFKVRQDIMYDDDASGKKKKKLTTMNGWMGERNRSSSGTGLMYRRCRCSPRRCSGR